MLHQFSFVLFLTAFSKTLSISETHAHIDLLFSPLDLLNDWGPLPFQIPIKGDIHVAIDSYGRPTDLEWKPQVVAGIQEVAALLQDEKRLVSTMHAEYGIINFALGLTGRISITGANVSEVLLVMQELDALDSWNLTKITSAQMSIGNDGSHVPGGAFQILFNEYPECASG